MLFGEIMHALGTSTDPDVITRARVREVLGALEHQQRNAAMVERGPDGDLPSPVADGAIDVLQQARELLLGD